MNEDGITCNVAAYVYEQVPHTDNSFHTSPRPMGIVIKLEAEKYPASYAIIGEPKGLTANTYEDLRAAVLNKGDFIIKERAETRG